MARMAMELARENVEQPFQAVLIQASRLESLLYVVCLLGS